MTTPIDGNRPTAESDATQRLDIARKADRPQADRRAETGDHVHVSKDAQLVTTAVKAANETPAIRQELVDRMRELLERGEIGNDAGQIAERLIDDLLSR